MIDKNKNTRCEYFKNKIMDLCAINGLDFVTVLKIAGFVNCANVVNEVCEYVECYDFIQKILFENKER